MQSVELQLAIAATLPAGYLCQDTKKVQSCRYLSIPSHVYMDATIRWGKNCDDCSAGFQNYSPCWVFLVCSSQYPAKGDQRNTRGQQRLTVAWVSDTRQLAQRPKKTFTLVPTERCQNPVRVVTDALSLMSHGRSTLILPGENMTAVLLGTVGSCHPCGDHLHTLHHW